mgnify:CR=1 FL=1
MKLCVVGAGYVGFSLSVLLSEKNEIVIYDIDKENDMFPPTFNSLTYYSVKNLEKIMNKE